MSKKSEQTKLFVGMASITDVRKKMTILSYRETRFDDISISRTSHETQTAKSLTQWTDSQILRFVPVVSFCHTKN